MSGGSPASVRPLCTSTNRGASRPGPALQAPVHGARPVRGESSPKHDRRRFRWVDDRVDGRGLDDGRSRHESVERRIDRGSRIEPRIISGALSQDRSHLAWGWQRRPRRSITIGKARRRRPYETGDAGSDAQAPAVAAAGGGDRHIEPRTQPSDVKAIRYRKVVGVRADRTDLKNGVGWPRDRGAATRLSTPTQNHEQSLAFGVIDGSMQRRAVAPGGGGHHGDAGVAVSRVQ